MTPYGRRRRSARGAVADHCACCRPFLHPGRAAEVRFARAEVEEAVAAAAEHPLTRQPE